VDDLNTLVKKAISLIAVDASKNKAAPSNFPHNTIEIVHKNYLKQYSSID
jgi:hypothetical protein